jgi:hypothetical protein
MLYWLLLLLLLLLAALLSTVDALKNAVVVKHGARMWQHC